jgi:flagellar basal-body rod protein FlgG
MLQGLYAAAAGMTAQQTRMDSTSNDLANVNTTGYKHQRVNFRDLLYVRDGDEGVQIGAGAGASTIGRSAEQGALQRTERPLDVAIQGPGFLEVRTPGGDTALTRAGALQVDSRGRLSTPNGDLLTGVRPLPAGTDASAVKIGPDGTVTVPGADGAPTALGRLRIVSVTSPDDLQPVGDNLLAVNADSGQPAPVAGSTLEQGVLEASNVDTGQAMADLVESQRAFAMASRAVQTQDQMMEIANGVKR